MSALSCEVVRIATSVGSRLLICAVVNADICEVVIDTISGPTLLSCWSPRCLI